MYGIVSLSSPAPVAREVRRVARSLVFAANSIALHAGLIAVLLVPKPHASDSKDERHPASLALIAAVSLSEPSSPAAIAPVSLLPNLPEPRLAIELSVLRPLAVEAVVADAFDSARAADSGADTIELERLQGVYLGQIQGRLSRVLEMAATSSPNEMGPCQVRVIQNERGEVLDVDLDACTFDSGRKLLLASAIRRASPLPSPPTGLAMGSSLTLDLSGY